jgi:hypothetical protein
MKPSLPIFTSLLLLLILTEVPLLAEEETPRVRKYYEYSGNYRDQTNALKETFQKKFGYELIDGDQEWTPNEINEMETALNGLPADFFNLKGFEGFLRMAQINLGLEAKGGDDIPAGTFPTFSTVHNVLTGNYVLRVGDGPLRIEIYNPLFYEDKELLSQIVQHEMGHVFDMTHGFASMTDEWIALSNFKVLNLPPLDAKPDANFIFTLVDDPDGANYAPVSTRQLPTYSRASIQEDFANSVSAYINYPYFRITNPERYRYLKDNVFKGKEYFESGDKGENTLESLVIRDFKKALDSLNWKSVKDIAIEINRSHFPALDKKLTDLLKEKMEGLNPGPDDMFIAKASCYLKDPTALLIRQSLARQNRILSDDLFKEVRCVQIGRDNFEKNMAKWPPMGLYYFRDEAKKDILQFMDSAIQVADSRNFSTSYFWKLYKEGAKEPFAKGSMGVMDANAGSLQIDLRATALSEFSWPTEGNVILELNAKRIHRKNMNALDSDPVKIRFKPFDWFTYTGPKNPGVFVRFPLALSYLDRP